MNNNTQIVISKTNCDGIGNVFKGFISALGIHSNVVIECNNDYMYGNYDTILDNKFIYSNNNSDNKIERFYTCRLLVLKEEEEFQENILNEFTYTNGCGNSSLNHLFSFCKLIDWNYDSSKICDKVKNRIFNTIDRIIFKNIIIDKVNLISKDFNNKNILGVSVRTWKSKHEHNIDRLYNFDIYKKEIINTILRNDIKKVVISFDNDSVKNDYITFLNNYDVEIIILEKNNNLLEINELQFAIIKVLVLSKCNYLIANRISTFSELIFWFSKCKIKVIPLF